ncbi:hypothetical protein BDQ17DRAFT_1424840 [Cyathus striatus]|nr:hypothetical protein BDQ17DRAFT_1424840 [Cyathus striatus]
MNGYCHDDMIFAIDEQFQDIEKLVLRLQSQLVIHRATETVSFLSLKMCPGILPLLQEPWIYVPIESYLACADVGIFLVENAMKQRSKGLYISMEGTHPPVHLSYVHLTMDVPDNYYDSLRISPDTNLIGNLHKELLMDICYNLRLVPVDEPESRSDLEDEVGDGERNSEEEEEEAEDGIEASDDENDGIKWW